MKAFSYLVKRPVLMFIIAFIILVLFAVTYYLIVRWKYPQMSERGLFGDTFGMFNAIFSGLAFAGVIYTIIGQQKEIESNTYAIHKDRFENTFFKMIELQFTITSALKEVIHNFGSIQASNPSVTSTTYTGREVVEYALGILKRQHINGPFDKSIDFKKKYEVFDDQMHHKFDRYLTNIDTIAEFIIHSTLTKDDKRFYVKLFALQLDENELAFYFYYHTLSNEITYTGGTEKSDGLDIIQFLRDEFLGDVTHLEFYYPREYLFKNGHYNIDESKAK